MNSLDWSSLLPEKQNNYAGSKISVIFLIIWASVGIVRGFIHIFAPDGGAGSIAGGFLNFIYTRRLFRTSNYPVLKLQPRTVKGGQVRHIYWPRTHLDCALDNVSSPISILDAELSIFVARPRRGLRFWQKRWIPYGNSISAGSITPNEVIGRGTDRVYRLS